MEVEYVLAPFKLVKVGGTYYIRVRRDVLTRVKELEGRVVKVKLLVIE